MYFFVWFLEVFEITKRKKSLLGCCNSWKGGLTPLAVPLVAKGFSLKFNLLKLISVK